MEMKTFVWLAWTFASIMFCYQLYTSQPSLRQRPQQWGVVFCLIAMGLGIFNSQRAELSRPLELASGLLAFSACFFLLLPWRLLSKLGAKSEQCERKDPGEQS